VQAACSGHSERRQVAASGETLKIPAVIMRGGTSKGVFFTESDLPKDHLSRDLAILAAFGSPDPFRRQIDGLGGATSTTSKVAIIGDGHAYGVDVTYEFGQVSIDSPQVDRRGTCGNISSAVGPYAVDQRFVQPVEPITLVRFLNTNTGKVVVAHVPTKDGRFDHRGDYTIPGIPGTASAIQLDYLDPGGAVTGSLLPTGNLTDVLELQGMRPLEVSIVDAANPLVFVNWHDVGLTGLEQPEEIDNDPALLARLESVRAAAAVLSGLAASTLEASVTVQSVPKLALVGAPRDYERIDGGAELGSNTTLRASMMSMGRAHRSYPLSGAICTAVAAAIPGTVISRVAGRLAEEPGACLIGHPSGVMSMSAEPRERDGVWSVDKVSGFRTARRLMEGAVFVDDEIVDGTDAL
jgi:2-methylaconitate cis-trans-isomerase PrpF